MKKLFLFTALAVTVFGCAGEEDWGRESVIPVTLKGIEAVNVDNSGEFPQIAVASVRKDAYMLGVRWVADNTPNDDEIFITGPIRKGEQTCNSIADAYSKAIKCNTRFNADIPAGGYVSKFFKEADRAYLPADVNEGFVLLVAPDPGEHSFTVEYYLGEELKFSHTTLPVGFL